MAGSSKRKTPAQADPTGLLDWLMQNRREAEQGPSVLDKPGEGIMRQIMDLFGPEAAISPMAGMAGKGRPQLGSVAELKQALKQAMTPFQAPDMAGFQQNLMTNLPETAKQVYRRDQTRLKLGQSPAMPRNPSQLVDMMAGLDKRTLDPADPEMVRLEELLQELTYADKPGGNAYWAAQKK